MCGLLTIDDGGARSLRRVAGEPWAWRSGGRTRPLADHVAASPDPAAAARAIRRAEPLGLMVRARPAPTGRGQGAPGPGARFPADFTIVALMDELATRPCDAPALATPSASAALRLGADARRALRCLLSRHNAVATGRPAPGDDLDAVLADAGMAGPWHVDLRREARPRLAAGGRSDHPTDAAEFYDGAGRLVAAAWRNAAGGEEEDEVLAAGFNALAARIALMAGPGGAIPYGPGDDGGRIH